MNPKLVEMIDYRSDKLIFYSNYSFLHLKRDMILKNVIQPQILNLANNQKSTIRIEIEGFEHYFIWELLEWDTDYFKMPTYRLHQILYAHDNYEVLKNAVQNFVQEYLVNNRIYCFCEIPSEDNRLVQALNESRFKLVETRLTYFLSLNGYSNQRFNVREAKKTDIQNIKNAAIEMRNPYDRFHSDPIFGDNKADEFLGKFAEESVNGFADYVIVPDEKDIPSDAFVTAKYLKSDWNLIGQKVSKMVLSSVSNKTCKGWYIKLISEMAYHLKSIGAEYAIMHPASTNKAVIHTYEKLGCKLGQVTNVLTYYGGPRKYD